MATTAVTQRGHLTGTEEASTHNSSTDMGGGMRCPNPSVHQGTSNVLQNQASIAALYITNPARVSEARTTATTNPLGSNGKLSSASAATSLKYARVQDLPSFPSIGIDIKSSASTAAVLANQNKKSPERWKPQQSVTAGKAALLANGYKMAPLWQPEASAAGSKAAMFAHQDVAKINLGKHQASVEGNSAANIAMRQMTPSEDADPGYTDQRRKDARTAAIGAHSLSERKRALSNPPAALLYPDSKNSAKNALSAATIAHSPSMTTKSHRGQPSDYNHSGQNAMEAARIQHAKSISKNMYTSTPSVALEVDERRRNDALRASAISMAKKIYDLQQQHRDGTGGHSSAYTGATAAHDQYSDSGVVDIKQQAMRYIGIQEAAQKLAQERLSKIGYDENAAYRSHYGYGQTSRSKFSMRLGRTRAKSASEVTPVDTSDSDEDDFRSRRIRSQMEQFGKQLADVDAKTRDTDRRSLMAAAQRKVQAQMQGMDKKIFDETGRMSQGMVDDWDEKARKRALANSEARMENHGKVHLGKGKWMDHSEIDVIAQARIQPTLDEIEIKTEKRFAADEKRKAEEDERRLALVEKKRRDREDKDRAIEFRVEERQLRDEEKRTAKARAVEEKMGSKKEKDHEKTTRNGASLTTGRDALALKEVQTVSAVVESTVAMASDNINPYQERMPTDPTETMFFDTATSRSPEGSTKGFKLLLNKLKRRSKPASEMDCIAKDKELGFVGGAAIRSSIYETQPQSSDRIASSQHETINTDHPLDLGDVEPKSIYVPHVDQPYLDVSSYSSDDEDAIEGSRGRTAQRIVSVGTARSGGTDFEEARDQFDTGLAPPPTFTSDADKASKGSPNRDSKFYEVGL